MRLYGLAGAVIRSELPLDEYAIDAGLGATAGVTLTLGEPQLPREFDHAAIVNHHAIDGKPFITVARDDGGYCLRLHDYADYLVQGDHIRCVPLPGCPESLLAQLFVHRILPNVISCAATPVFHASAVASHARAAIFLGDPGAGKSTLASAMVPPAIWMSDDCTTLELAADEIIVHPGSSFARLCADSLEALGDGEPAHPARNEKWRLRRDASPTTQQLGSMFVLGSDSALRFEPMTLRDAVAELARHLFRIDPEDRQALLDELVTLERIAKRVPMFVLHYPRRFEHLGDACEAVLSHLR